MKKRGKIFGLKTHLRKSQVSIEYLIIVGFVTFAIIGILGIALFYSSSIKDKMKETQLTNYANKIISTSESVFYAGEPSKATITAYLPDNIDDIEINEDENALVITYRTTSGVNVKAFDSNVPISESVGNELSDYQGSKRIEVIATEDEVVIKQL